MSKNDDIKAKYPLGGRPVAFKSPEEMQKKMYEYLDRQSNRVSETMSSAGVVRTVDPAPITVEGFCVSAGITKASFYNYARKPKFRTLCNQFRQIVESYLVEQLVDGKKGNKADFILKNAFGDEWKEKSDVSLNGAVKGICIKVDAMADEDDAN